MALSEGECQKCRVELDKLKAQYEGAGEVPDVAKARLGELEAALEGECSGSSDDSSGAGVVLVGLVGLGLLAAFLAAVYGSRR